MSYSATSMTVPQHIIDLDPDTIIHLRNPCTSFALCEADKRTPPPEVDVVPKRKETPTMKKKRLARERRSAGLSENQRTIEENNPHFFGGQGVNAPAESSNSGQAGLFPEDTTDANLKPEKKDMESIVLYYVSSHHLRSASPWFRRALASGNWVESGRDENDGLIHILAEDWDSAAFLILLKIFHLKHRQVPRKIPLEDLAKIAVLVDYYECAEAVELFTNMWKEALIASAPVPSTYCRNLTLWVWVAWVFEWIPQFNDATLVAIKECPEPLPTLELPFPSRVSDRINLRRYRAIDDVIEALHKLRKSYESLDYVCPQNKVHSFSCGSILYGAITKEMLSIQILSPRPELPFAGMSLNQLCTDVRKFKSPTWSCSSNSGYYNQYHQPQTCNLTNAVTDVIDAIATAFTGLDLQPLKEPDSLQA